MQVTVRWFELRSVGHSVATALAVGGLTVERSVRPLGEYAAPGIPLAVVAEPYGVG